jgi:hypothetical protein
MTNRQVFAIFAAILVLAIVFSARFERLKQLQSIDGITSAASLHVAPDGRLVVTETGGGGAADGRVLLLDPQNGRRDIAIDALFLPWGADMAADGTVCVVLQGRPPGQPEFRCSDGRRVDLSQLDVGPEAPAQPRDVVWDGATGWFVAEPTSGSLLHISSDGTVDVVATFEESIGGLPALPVGLTRSADGRLWLALLDAGIAVMPLEAGSTPGPAQDVGGDRVVAVIPVHGGEIVLKQRETMGSVVWCCGGHGDRLTLVEGLLSPRGLALLPDGRLAVSANGVITLYSTDSLPGS